MKDYIFSPADLYVRLPCTPIRTIKTFTCTHFQRTCGMRESVFPVVKNPTRTVGRAEKRGVVKRFPYCGSKNTRVVSDLPTLALIAKVLYTIKPPI